MFRLFTQYIGNKVHRLNTRIVNSYHSTHDFVRYAILLDVPSAKRKVVYSCTWLDLYFDYLLSLVLRRQYAWYTPMNVQDLFTNQGVVFVRTWDGNVALLSARNPNAQSRKRCLFATVCHIDVTRFVNEFSCDIAYFTVREAVVLMHLLGYIKTSTCIEALFNENTRLELISDDMSLTHSHLMMNDKVCF